MSRAFIAVACADHVARGRAGGFMQVCHGKGGPLKRLKAGDLVVYYSPTQTFGGGPPLRAFTALGVVTAREPYQFDMGGGFVPFRRDVGWRETKAAPIAPLLDALDFTRGNRNWGYALRFGLVEIGIADGHRIAAAMQSEALAESTFSA